MRIQREAAQPPVLGRKRVSPQQCCPARNLSSSPWLFDLSEHSHNLNIYSFYFPVLSWIFGNVLCLLFGSSPHCCCYRVRAGSPCKDQYGIHILHSSLSNPDGQPMDFSSLSIRLSESFFVFSFFPHLWTCGKESLAEQAIAQPLGCHCPCKTTRPFNSDPRKWGNNGTALT